MVLNAKNLAEVPQILVIDDDKRLRDLLFKYLGTQGCLVICAENAAEAEEYLKRFVFDMVVIDVMMPGESGIEFTRRIKPEYQNLPFLMLTARAETEARIEGLEAGVDDYLSKPFEPKELWLRIQAILRRSAALKPSKSNKIGEYTFDAEMRTLESDDRQITLTESETLLLKFMHNKAGETVDRYELAEGLGLDSNERTVDVQITRLRKKMEADPKTPRYLQTVRGKGYVLRV